MVVEKERLVSAVARMMDAIEGRPVDSAGDVIPVSLREADTTRR